MATSGRPVLAAIDFGTTYSGYAYALRDIFAADKTKVVVNNWNSGEGISYKAPTVVLLDEAGKFNSFGYEKLHTTMSIKDDQGKPFEAVTVFAEAIRYLKGHLMNKLCDRFAGIEVVDIDWVLTLPAIWNESAKQFMVLAAEKAGIPRQQLILSYEPEVAAIFCKEMKFQLSETGDLDAFNTGARVMVIDLGGGTADITTFDVQDDGSMISIAPPSGGAWGGTTVDRSFQELLENVFGRNVMQRFAKENKDDKLFLERQWEIKKRTIMENVKRVIIQLPLSLTNETTKPEFQQNIQKSDYTNMVSTKGDKLIIQNEICIQMFDEARNNLLPHIEKELAKVGKLKTIIMVGGFSESDVMKSAVKNKFKQPEMDIFIPDESGLAVVKGAVMYGFNTRLVSGRTLGVSYGVLTSMPEKSLGIFKVLIPKGTRVVPGQTAAEDVFNSQEESTACVEIYKSDLDAPPMYEIDCERVANLHITLRNKKRLFKVPVRVKIDFGQVIATVTAVEEDEENNVVDAHMDWLL